MRCIECEEIELARVRDELPSQTLPIPYAAIDGFPAGRSSSDLTRRRLMQWGVAGMASIYGAKQLGWETIWESVAAASEDAATDKCLVLLYLAGGNDGLNVILPTSDYSYYADARPALKRGQGPTTVDRVGSTALRGPGGAALAFSNVTVSKNGGGDNADARFNFDTTVPAGQGYGFDSLFGDGTGGPGSDLAVMPAVDAIPYSLSHFDNSDVWFEASTDLTNKTGWLGRWIDRNLSQTNPLQAISIDSALSKSIRTEKNPVCAIPSLSALGFSMSGYGNMSGDPTKVDVNAQMDILASVATAQQNAYLGRSRDTYGLAVDTYTASRQGPAYAPGAGYPNASTLSTRLRLAAHLLSANLGTRIITIHWGGFDTHTNQIAAQDKQLAELSRALGAFRADLLSRGIEQRVATLVFSEFGRRVKETPNSAADVKDAGTDHGAGGLMLAMGSGVRGGFASEWPGCAPNQLVPINNPGQGNLKVPTDFRSVYKAVIEEWLGDPDPQALLGGAPIKDLVRGDGLKGRKLSK
jgi:uncharacterized protein (DUF1501 family)